MGAFFTVTAFIVALGLSISAVNAISPFSPAYVTAPDLQLSSANILGVSGCSTASLSGGGNCTSSANSASSPSFFGVTQFIFGNFLAALTFLTQMAIAIFIPGQYVLGWLGGPGNPAAIAIAAIFQGLVSIAYAYDFFYILSGRWIFPS